MRKFSTGSFISLAKERGTEALLGNFKASNGFDSAFKGMRVLKLSPSGVSVCSLTVTENLKNAFGTLHGGAICTLVDIGGTLSLLAHEKNVENKPGVSIEISTTFCSKAAVGEEIEIHGKVLRIGKRVGFTNVDIINSISKEIVASGRHTKFF